MLFKTCFIHLFNVPVFHTVLSLYVEQGLVIYFNNFPTKISSLNVAKHEPSYLGTQLCTHYPQTSFLIVAVNSLNLGFCYSDAMLGR